MNNLNSTPMPWNKSGKEVMALNMPVASCLYADDAALIVKAVNSHADLVDALKRSQKHLETARGLFDETKAAYHVLTEVIEQNSAALAKAQA